MVRLCKLELKEASPLPHVCMFSFPEHLRYWTSKLHQQALSCYFHITASSVFSLLLYLCKNLKRAVL